MSVANRKITSHFVRKIIDSKIGSAKFFRREKMITLYLKLLINNFLAESLELALARSH